MTNEHRKTPKGAKVWLRRIEPGHLIISLMGAVAGTSVLGAVDGVWLVPLSALGALVALITVPIASRLRLVTPEWMALSIIVFLLVGGPAVGGIPSPGSYQDFFGGLVNGWVDLLSSVPPVTLQGEFRVLPYALAWLAAVSGFALLRHFAVPGLAGVGPLTCFGLGLLFSLEDQTGAMIQGGTLVGLALALGIVQQRELGLESDASMGNTTVARKRARFLGAGAILLAVAVASPAIALLIPGLGDRDRFDLRDTLEPPWQPLNEPSPLAQIKGNYRDEVKSDVVFVAEGDIIPDRWALATLAHFDGTVWTVGDSNIGGAAPFVPTDTYAPVDPHPPTNPSAPVAVSVDVVDLGGPWLPVPGRMNSISVVGADNSDTSLRFNQSTGTLAMPGGVSGAKYVVEARPWPLVAPSELESVSLTPSRITGLDGQTGVVRSSSADLIEGVEQGWPQVAAIKTQLQQDGFYLADDRVRPGHSWARLSEFLGDDQWYGNEEQYAAVAAIVLRNAGLNVRVVVGFDIDNDRSHSGRVEILRQEASAWIEVLSDEYGWIPVDVTPDRDKEPSLTDPGVRTKAVAAPNPPPPPPPPLEIVAETPDSEDDEDEPEVEEPVEKATMSLALVGAGAVGTPVGIGAIWLAVVAATKTATCRRRRSRGNESTRVAGAWFEASDRLLEAGRAMNPKLSVTEQARHIGSTLASNEELGALAELVDRAAFDSMEPTDSDVEHAWLQVNGLRQELKQEASPIQRLIRLANPAPILRRGDG